MAEKLPASELEELRVKLEEAEATLEAIRNGEVDALVVGGKEIYTLEGADHPYRLLVEAMQQGAVTVSPIGAIVYCNRSFEQMVGRTAEKIVGHDVTSFFDRADKDILTKQLCGRDGKQLELRLASPRGPLPVLVSFNRMPLGGITAVCLVITDLTEHKHNLRLQDSDRRKDEFLAMLAHELRNPLAPIANAARLLSLYNDGSNEEMQWACDVVDRQVRQMTRIVDDLLDISRITSGKIKLQRKPLEVATIISAAVEMSRPLIEARQHRFEVSVPSEPLRVDADLTRMAQVVTNLLNNAAKYTEPGGVVSLKVHREGEGVVITVRDNGVGIPQDMLPVVFDLFTQAERTIDRAQGGLGIGLTLVRTLVELHKGTVRVSSEGAGKGSEFTVMIPLISDTAALNGVQKNGGRGSAQATSQRVLVVDDNVDSANSLAMMLKMMGHELMVAHDGPDAIRMAQVFHPTLTLLDIGLPGMNGYLVAEQLRNIPELEGMVIAALTGYGEPQDRKRSRAAGFDRHFVKPLNFEKLNELIDSMSQPIPIHAGL